MEASLIRRPAVARLMRRAAIACLLCAAFCRPALAACDFNELIGYTLIYAKTVEGYIQNGRKSSGFHGCTRDRVLVFSDNTGVRCKDTSVQEADFPRVFLFAKDVNDMKLCVGDVLLDVAQAN